MLYIYMYIYIYIYIIYIYVCIYIQGRQRGPVFSGKMYITNSVFSLSTIVF